MRKEIGLGLGELKNKEIELQEEVKSLKKEVSKLRHFAEVVKALSYLGNDKDLERLASRVLKGEENEL